VLQTGVGLMVLGKNGGGKKDDGKGKKGSKHDALPGWIVAVAPGWFLTRVAGEGDRRRRWRGRMADAALVAAPSTMLRMVPLPRRERRGRNPAAEAVLRSGH
jgi:hypothetical protein